MRKTSENGEMVIRQTSCRCCSSCLPLLQQLFIAAAAEAEVAVVPMLVVEEEEGCLREPERQKSLESKLEIWRKTTSKQYRRIPSYYSRGQSSVKGRLSLKGTELVRQSVGRSVRRDNRLVDRSVDRSVDRRSLGR